MAELFGRDVKTIGKHVNNVFREGELEESATVAKFATVQLEGQRQVERQRWLITIWMSSLSVGYRVKSQRGVQFRRWATRTLKQHLVEGFTLNQQRGSIKNFAPLGAQLQLAFSFVHRTIP